MNLLYNNDDLYTANEVKKELNQEAVFSDGTSMFRIPMEPEPGQEVIIRIRTEKNNVDKIELIADNFSHSMRHVFTKGIFDYYEAVITTTDKNIRYYFMLYRSEMIYYYNQIGLTKDEYPEYHFIIMPGFKTPDWAKGAVFYQIFVDRFSDGDTNNNVLDNEYSYIGKGTTSVKDWNKYPDVMGVREFYGGDLKGILNKLDYLCELGVEVLYLNPIFVSPSNHKYDIQDYDYVDPHYGVIVNDEGNCLQDGETENRLATRFISRVTDKVNLEKSNKLFIKLVEEVHRRGMKVILDGVFNHCGSFNKWLDRERIYENAPGYEKGAYITKDSPYLNYFRFKDAKDEDAWPYNSHYDGWWGYDTLPKLNYEESKELYDYIMYIGRKWVSPPFNVDGWRLDVAADLGLSSEYNHKFWKDFRKNVKAANPDAIILAEQYGNPETWLQGDEWDTVMNYDAFMEPVTWFLTGVEKHSDEYRGDLLCNHDAFFGAMNHYMAKFNTQSLLVAMNELSNHDHSRFMTRTNHRVGRVATVGSEAANQDLNPAIMREAVMIQMTWPGAPTIYYGDEAGVCGWTDPDSRRAYPWGNEDYSLLRLHRELIKIHKAYQVLRTGSIKFLVGMHGVIGYGRFDEHDAIIVVVNNNPYEVNVDIPVWQVGIIGDRPMIRLAYTNETGYGVDMEIYWSENGLLHVRLNAYSSLMVMEFPEYLLR